MNKKGDLSLNIVIIAAIGLIVLIVLAVIFSGKLSMFGKSTSNVSGNYQNNKCNLPGSGRECVSTNPGCTASNGIKVEGSFDCGSGKECCLL